MNGFKMVVDAIGIFFELYIAFTYFGVIFGKSCLSKKYQIAFYMICVCINFIVSILLDDFPLLIIAVINVTMYFIITYAYQGATAAKVFSAILLYAFFVAFDIISGIILVNIFNINVETAQTNTSYYLQGLLLSRFDVFVLVKLIGMNKKARIASTNFKVSVILMLFSLASVMAICTIASFTYNSTEVRTSLLSSFSIIALILSNVFIFYVFERQGEIEQTKERLKFIQDQLQSQVEHYKELYDAQQETRRIWHDMKNSLMAVSGYISNNENQEALAYIDDLCGSVSKAIHIVDTGCPAIDAILKAKIQKAENSGAVLQYNIVLPKSLNVDMLDLAVLLANGLDNAVEAVENIEQANRVVTLNIMPRQDYIFIMISNPAKGNLNVNELKTTKSDKLNHGFGLENIRTIANKYGGDVNIEYQDTRFTLSVVLQNKL